MLDPKKRPIQHRVKLRLAQSLETLSKLCSIIYALAASRNVSDARGSGSSDYVSDTWRSRVLTGDR